MAFDLEKALRDGHTEKSIANYLGTLHDFDTERARGDGRTDSEIIGYLMDITERNAPEDIPSHVPTEPIQKPLLEPPVDIPTYGGFGDSLENLKGTGADFVTPEIIGATVGEMLGSRLGLPGRVAGAGLGGAAGNILRQETRRLTTPLGKQPRPLDIKRAGKEGLEQAAFGLAGEGVARGAKRIAKPFAPVAEKGLETAGKLMEKFGGVFTLGQRTKNRAFDWFEAYAEGSLLGGGKIVDIKRQQTEKVIPSIVNDVLDTFGTRRFEEGGIILSKEEWGKALSEGIQENNEAFKSYARGLYSKIDEMTKGVTKKIPLTEKVPTKIIGPDGKPMSKTVTRMVDKEVGGVRPSTLDLKRWARGIKKESKQIAGLDQTEAGIELIDRILELDDTLSWKAAQNLRSSIFDRMQRVSKKDKAFGLAKKAMSFADRSMEDAAKGFSGDLLNAWRVANKFYKEGKGYFQKRWIRVLIDMADEDSVKYAPEKIGEFIFKKGRVTQIEKVMNAMKTVRNGEFIRDPVKMRRVRAGYIDALMENVTNDVGEITGKKFISKVKDPITAKVLGPGAHKRVKDFADLVAISQGLTMKTRAGGQMVAQISQGGAIIQLAGAPILAGFGLATQGIAGLAYGAAVFIPPYILSHVVTDTVAGKLLVNALKGSIKGMSSKELNNIIIRLLGETLRIKMELGQEPQGGELPKRGTIGEPKSTVR